MFLPDEEEGVAMLQLLSARPEDAAKEAEGPKHEDQHDVQG